MQKQSHEKYFSLTIYQPYKLPLKLQLFPLLLKYKKHNDCKKKFKSLGHPSFVDENEMCYKAKSFVSCATGNMK